MHGTAGAWGVLAVRLFATDGGLLHGGGFGLLGAQIVGVGAIVAWTFTASTIVFAVIKKTWGLRVTLDEELAGLDRIEHGSEAYPEFAPTVERS